MEVRNKHRTGIKCPLCKYDDGREFPKVEKYVCPNCATIWEEKYGTGRIVSRGSYQPSEDDERGKAC